MYARRTRSGYEARTHLVGTRSGQHLGPVLRRSRATSGSGLAAAIPEGAGHRRDTRQGLPSSLQGVARTPPRHRRRATPDELVARLNLFLGDVSEGTEIIPRGGGRWSLVPGQPVRASLERR